VLFRSYSCFFAIPLISHELSIPCGFLWLLAVLDLLAVRFPDTKLLQAVLKRAEGETEELGGLGDVVVRLLHRLRDEIALHVFEVDPFRRQLERAFRRWSSFLTYFRRQVFRRDQIAFTKQNRALNRRLQLPHIPGPTVVVH